MAEVILMPRLSDTMTEGVIAAWHKKVGDTVKKGDLLAEVETDKATMELESYKDGTLLHIGTDKGGKLQVNDLLAIIGSKGEDISGLLKSGGSNEAKQPEKKTQEKATDKAQGNGDKTQAPKQETKTQGASIDISKMEEVVLMPRLSDTMTEGVIAGWNKNVGDSVKKGDVLEEKGIDINKLSGSGDGGRIVKADIDSYKPAAATTAAPSGEKKAAVPSFAPIVSGQEAYTDIPNSQIRNIIAKRLAESKFSAPHFYLTMEINMDNAISARNQLNEVSPVKISFNDLVVKAAALALRQHPAVNASWMGDKIRRYQHIHIGIA